mgnify:CR=1 FL=1|tara:strand:- start:7464 stop:8354 length:891 start_codon:yes stop_codon:yes gene_type:complete
MSLLDQEQFLIPLLTQGTADNIEYHDPEKFLEEYGMYLPEYDSTDEILKAQERDILQQNIISGAKTNFRELEPNIGKMSNINTYYNTGNQNMLDTISNQLSIVNIKALEDKKRLQKSYLQDMYSSVANLAYEGAFDEESLGMESISESEIESQYPGYFGLDSADTSTGQAINEPEENINIFTAPDITYGNQPNFVNIIESSLLEALQIDNPDDLNFTTDMIDQSYWETFTEFTGQANDAYATCLEGATTASEQEFCAMSYQADTNNINQIIASSFVCDPNSDYYNEEACSNISLGG